MECQTWPQHVIGMLGKFLRCHDNSNPLRDYTLPKYSLWCNQVCENMKLVFRHFCWILNAKIALSIIISDLENSKVRLELTFLNTFALIFKRSKPCRFWLTNLPWRSLYFVLTHRNKIFRHCLIILHQIILQKWHFLILSYITLRFIKNIFHANN